MIAAINILIVCGLILASGQAYAVEIEVGPEPDQIFGTVQDQPDESLASPVPTAAGPEPVPVAAPVPLDSFGQAIAARLAAGAPGSIGAERVTGDRLSAVYAARNYVPLWFDPGPTPGDYRGPGPRAAVLRDIIATADREGLDPQAYHPTAIAQVWSARTLDEKADLDLLLTDALLRYAGHLRGGRIVPRKVTADYWFSPVQPDPITVVRNAFAAPDLRAYLETLAPPHALYADLRSALEHYRFIEKIGGWPTIRTGQKLVIGVKDSGVKALRAHLRMTGDLDSKLPVTNLYDRAVSNAVRSFQARHALKPDGVVGSATLVELNVPVGDRIRTILANMERVRWLPESLGRRHVFVNVAAYELAVVESGKATLTMPVIVGTVKRRTPLFSSAISNVVFNPPWTVPVTLAREDFLPKLRQDPNYLASKNIRLYSSWHSNAAELDPLAIDWNTVGRGEMAGYRLRQAPGAGNALGRIKFNMANPFDVYLHDTPDQRKFRTPERAYSSGCVRVSDPVALAEVVFAESPDWTAARRQSALDSGRTRYVSLERSVPVHLFYLTAWQDEHGKIQFRRDVYGWDTLLLESLQRRGERSPSVAAAGTGS